MHKLYAKKIAIVDEPLTINCGTYTGDRIFYILAD